MKPHRVKLKVKQLDGGEVYRDIVRVPQVHRGGIDEGTMCLLKYCSKSTYVALRGLGDEKAAIILLDDRTRGSLGIREEVGRDLEFTIKPIGFLRRYWALQSAADPFVRTSYQMSMIAFFLGVVSLLPLVKDVIAWACR